MTKFTNHEFFDRFCLGGSRSFALRAPDIIKVNDDTDYDFYGVDNEDNRKFLMDFMNPDESTIFNYIIDAPKYYLDDLATTVVTIPDSVVVNLFTDYEIIPKVQVVLRSDAYTYGKVWSKIDPVFYRDYIWKSGPNKPSFPQIQEILNQMFKMVTK